MATGVPAHGYDPEVAPLPDATHIGGVRLQVADLQRSIDYYTGVVGLQVSERAGSTVRLGPRGGGPTLVTLEEDPAVQPVPRSGRFGLFHFAILLPDRAALGRFVLHLQAIGVRFASADHAVSEAIYLWDPDGLGIEVYADRPRSTWTFRQGELVMVTEPLDVVDLTRSALHGQTGSAVHGVPQWGGAPAGTMLGHMHLHVGDLDRASAFYHSRLGLDRIVWSYPGALFMSAGGYHHHLAVNTWSRGPSAGRHEARLLEWALVVPGEHAAAAAAARIGGSRVEDPWGTRVAITPA